MDISILDKMGGMFHAPPPPTENENLTQIFLLQHHVFLRKVFSANEAEVSHIALLMQPPKCQYDRF